MCVVCVGVQGSSSLEKASGALDAVGALDVQLHVGERPLATVLGEAKVEAHKNQG